MNTQPGTRVITPAGRHGAIAHPYTNDAGVRVAYVKIDGQERKSQYRIDELRPEPTTPTPEKFVGAWCEVHGSFHVCAYSGRIER